MRQYMKVDGVAIKRALKEKGIKQSDASLDLGRSHAYLSNCLSQGYLEDKDLRYLCAKHGIPYFEVKRGWAHGNVTKYESVRTRDKIKAEKAVVESNPMSADDKMDLILRNMLELNKMMAELIRRNGNDNK